MQHFCLKWNNHQENMLSVFEELLRSESFTDVNFISEDRTVIKCHRIVLAACSLRFQELFVGSPSYENPTIVMADAKTSEIKAIVEYMYKGEVSVAQDQLPGLMKVAEVLQIKGLIAQPLLANVETEIQHQKEQSTRESGSSSSISGSSTSVPPKIPSSTDVIQSPPPRPHSINDINYYRNYYGIFDKPSDSKIPPHHLNSPPWAIPNIPLPQHPAIPAFSQNVPIPKMSPGVEPSYDASNLPPIKRKRTHSFNSRDTPILRTVLGQSLDTTSSQPPLIGHSNGYDAFYSNNLEKDYADQHIKTEPFEADQDNKALLKGKNGTRFGQKTQRYKQYTSTCLQKAIDSVRCNKMSALKASVVFNIPSRTLYDKIKKMGIIRDKKKRKGGENLTEIPLPRRRSGTNSPSDEQLSDNEETLNHLENNADILSARNYLHNDRYDPKCEDNDPAEMSPNEDILRRSPNSISDCYTASYLHHYKKLAAAALARERHSFESNSVPEDVRNYTVVTEKDNNEDDDENQVEDLSMKKPPTTGVIMSPTSQRSTIIQKEEALKEAIKEEKRWEVSCKDVE